MPRVAVVGGGVAGRAAAAEAARRGTSVSLFEASSSLPAPRSAWADLIGRGTARPWSRGERSLLSLGVELRIGERVKGVASGCKVASDRGRFGFDAVIVATGGRPVWRSIPGIRKDGVHILDSPASVARAAEPIASSGCTIVWGWDPFALEVAQLVSSSAPVIVMAPGGILSAHLNAAPIEAFHDSLRKGGLKLLERGPEKVIGSGKVEAVTGDGEVYPCDTLLLVPSTTPDPVSSEGLLGDEGGLVVDAGMRTTQAGVFAAGSCAELRRGRSAVRIPFEGGAVAMGATAGCNSGGDDMSAGAIPAYGGSHFGVEVAFAGLSTRVARRAGLAASEFTTVNDGTTVSLVFDRRDHRIYGIQSVGPGSAAALPAISAFAVAGARLEDVAYATLTTDISSVAQTAREAMRQ